MRILSEQEVNRVPKIDETKVEKKLVEVVKIDPQEEKQTIKS